MEQIEALYENSDTAIFKGVSGFLALREQTLQELKGVFTRKELFAIFSAQNGVLLEPEMQCIPGVLAASVEDSYTSECCLSSDEVNMEVLLDKINNLSSAQVYYLQDEIERTWNNTRTEGDHVEIFLDAYESKK